MKNRYLSPKGVYYWSDADWYESICTLAQELPDLDAAMYKGMAKDYLTIMPTEFKSLYSKVLKAVMNHKFPM